MVLMKWPKYQSGKTGQGSSVSVQSMAPGHLSLPRKPLLSGAKGEGLRGSTVSTSEASFPVHGCLYPVQELGDLSVDSWLLPTFLAPAYNPIDVVSAILFTG